jgi:uncharacterized protein (TIGR00299 family) protein
MALASLVDAGADIDQVLELVRRVGINGWSVSPEAVLRNGLAATYAGVRADETGVVRTYADITKLLADAKLPDRVRQRSLAVFAALARVEGRVHRRPPAQVHFHEVGGIDAIVDVVGTCAALEVLAVDVVTASSVATGTGMIRSAHGPLPNPAPAVVGLLEGAVTHGLDIDAELTTPTGAALLAAMAAAFGPMPAMRITATGFGAGARELETLPNLTQVVIGTGVPSAPPAAQPMVLLATNVDDATGETMAHTVSALLEAGAVDAWITPIVMKKGRPAYTVSALGDPVLGRQLIRVLSAETGTLGVRASNVQRWPVARSIETVELAGEEVRVKVSPGRVKAEYADAARVAAGTGMPLREVARRAEAAWHARSPDDERQPETTAPPQPDEPPR